MKAGEGGSLTPGLPDLERSFIVIHVYPAPNSGSRNREKNFAFCVFYLGGGSYGVDAFRAFPERIANVIRT